MTADAPNREPPPGYGKGNFVPLGLLEYREAYATMLQAVAGVLPRDPTMPTEIRNERGERVPFPDTPTNRGVYAAGKLFEDEAKRASFYFRTYSVMPLAREPKYSRYRNDKNGTMHLALLAAVATMPCNARATKKVLRAALEAAFRAALSEVEPGEGERKH